MLGLADGKVHGKGRAVRAEANDFAANADDLGFAAVEVVGDVAVMFMPIRLRHQHLDVFANDLVGKISEQSFTRRIEHQHDAARVDQDRSVNGGFNQGAHPPRAFVQRSFGRFAFSDVAVDLRRA